MNKETSNINLNIYDYNIDDLLTILNLQYNPSISEINKATSSAISKYSDSDENDPDVILFLQNANKILIKEFSNNGDQDNDNNNDNDNNDSNDSNEKLTNRTKPPDIIQDNKHFLIKQKQMGITNNYSLPAIQDTLNPTLNNINSTIINLDSQFRPNILPFEPLNPDSVSSSTNYTLDLTEPLTNVLSLKLYSVQIPNTWYRFSENQGNICFFLDFINNNNPSINTTIKFKFVLPAGNYTENDMIIQLNTPAYWFNIITNTPALTISPLEWTYNSNTNKFSFKSNYGLTYAYNIIFYLYDINGVYSCSHGCTSVSNLNQNLGWNLGFRSPLVDGVSYAEYLENNITTSDNNTTFELPAILDINGPKYFAIILDDFNQNRQNKGLVNIGTPDTKLNIPSYYEPNIMECNLIRHGLQFPRTTTKAQIYTLNEILKNRTTSKIRNYGVNSSDVFAILPIDVNINTQSIPYTSFGTNLILNERKYFGPVNISRLKLRLVDDKGNTINLNGADWCISLITTELYQY